MVPISALPLYRLFTHLLVAAPLFTFVAVLTMSLPAQLAARKLALAKEAERRRCAERVRASLR
jgi:hypothetical protein